ncbi:variable surface lipoprotein, partial [Xanthomonas citri pv. citri]|nr:variable surface lipoprotein [Xanthomonas citri pv. citri]
MKQQNKILLIASASILSPASVVVAAKCNTSNKP